MVTRQALEDAVRAAFVKTGHTSAPHPANDGQGWRIAWGDPDKGLDIQHVNAPGGEVNLNQVTGYIAKYVTKGTEVTGLDLRRVDDLIVEHLDLGTHTGRLIRACWDLGDHADCWRLRRYAHQYGYGGHITTKSRRFSVTLGFLREQRTIWRRTEGHPAHVARRPGRTRHLRTRLPSHRLASPPATPSSPTPPPPTPASTPKPAALELQQPAPATRPAHHPVAA